VVKGKIIIPKFKTADVLLSGSNMMYNGHAPPFVVDKQRLQAP